MEPFYEEPHYQSRKFCQQFLLLDHSLFLECFLYHLGAHSIHYLHSRTLSIPWQ
ncbi:hypothetical protein XBJ1_2815 [Xenorhabdus bovienii SS-2004]|uniref:Uncharacterized protein n=1 Tax=Xenorhabdus bovienii (strain SS-2004) TaxID=406818 RepID=D3V7X7_XENBS|nr:hypothetical protein XBJ1_2815 [Xenorhabdus bovienii SS-2004]